MSEALEERERLRLLFMTTVYEKTHGDRFTFTSLADIAPVLSITTEEAGRIGQFLVDRGLIEWAAFGGVIAITHRGVVEIEQAQREPGSPTEFFPPFNVIHIEHMTNSHIQQGTTQSVQNINESVAAEETRALAEFLDDIRRRKSDLGLGAETVADLDAQVATLDAQMRSPQPKRAVLRMVGGVLMEILKSASGAAAGELVKHAPAVLR
jgi:hypothetical protein